MKSSSYVSFLLLALALLSWGAVALFGWDVSAAEQDRVSQAQRMEESSARDARAIRENALARDTQDERERVADLLNVDIVSVVDTIEGIGKSSGVRLKLSGALPESVLPSKENVLSVRTVGFIVEADGTFANIMRAARLFEMLPVPSSVQRLDIERVPITAGVAGAGPWHMSAYIRIFTTSNI